MAKAILELEMPEGCWQCPCIQDKTETYRWCGVVGGDCPNPPYEKRRDDCPLKPIEEPIKQPECCPNCGYKTVSDGKYVCCFACGYNV